MPAEQSSYSHGPEFTELIQGLSPDIAESFAKSNRCCHTLRTRRMSTNHQFILLALGNQPRQMKYSQYSLLRRTCNAPESKTTAKFISGFLAHPITDKVVPTSTITLARSFDVAGQVRVKDATKPSKRRRFASNERNRNASVQIKLVATTDKAFATVITTPK